MIHVPAYVIAQVLSSVAILKLGVAKQFSLTSSQLLALVLVGGNKRLSIKELKGKLSLPGSSLTFAMESLERKRLIKRERSKEDKRQWFLSLTAKGEQLYADILKAESEAVSPALSKISETEREIFLRLAAEINRLV